MKPAIATILKFSLLALAWLVWIWMLGQTFCAPVNLAILVGSILLVFPASWLGRHLLNKNPTTSRAAWVTLFVHYAVGILIGIGIIRAIVSRQDWFVWNLPVLRGFGLVLMILSGAAFLLTVLNLALKGLGAPFAIALSSRLAVDWLYAWTRNPMVLAALAFLLSLGLWYQSALFLLWVLFLFSPALLFFVKAYEERELEVRFGASYLEYRARTPFIFPRKPKG
jgi:protein-S-isoprenylcysteine O-methyltransferase Ste14